MVFAQDGESNGVNETSRLTTSEGIFSGVSVVFRCGPSKDDGAAGT